MLSPCSVARSSEVVTSAIGTEDRPIIRTHPPSQVLEQRGHVSRVARAFAVKLLPCEVHGLGRVAREVEKASSRTAVAPRAIEARSPLEAEAFILCVGGGRAEKGG